MTTLFSNSTGISFASDAAFRTVGTELNGWFVTVGLVQTADTGQIDWTTITRGTANTIIGYEVWRFTDSSLYFKLEWHANVSGITNSPGFWLTVGTGSDGSGGITGIKFPRTQITPANNALNAGNKSTYICHTADFLGVIYKIGGTAGRSSTMAFVIEKAVDSSGAVIGTSNISVSYLSSSTTAIINKWSTDGVSTWGPSTAFVCLPGNLTSSDDGSGGNEVFPHSFRSPGTVFSNFMGTVVASEATLGTTLTATLVGAASHTYISIANAMGTGNSVSASTSWSVVMLWE